MKVFRIIARLNIGGPAIHVTNLMCGLDRRTYEQTLICGVEGPGEGSMLKYVRARGVMPVVIPELVGDAGINRSDLQVFKLLYKIIHAQRPDIVHTHTSKAGVLGRLAARLSGVPVVIHTFHGHVLHGYFGHVKTRAVRVVERGLAHLSDRLIAVSEQVKNDLVGYRVADPGKIEVIPLGFDLAPFVSSTNRKGELRRELGIGTRQRLVGIVGRLVPIKNHRLFLDAIARVMSVMPDMRAVVVGDGDLRGPMEAHARELGIESRVSFLGWRADVEAVYADLDLLVVSSRNEGTPVSAIEAMASGVPVVAVRVGGLADIIDDGATGYLVGPGSIDGLASAIRRALEDRNAGRIGAAARQAAIARFNVERLIRDIESLYRRVWLERQ